MSNESVAVEVSSNFGYSALLTNLKSLVLLFGLSFDQRIAINSFSIDHHIKAIVNPENKLQINFK